MRFSFHPPFPRAIHLPIYEAHVHGRARRSTTINAADMKSAQRAGSVWLGVHWRKVRVARYEYALAGSGRA